MGSAADLELATRLEGDASAVTELPRGWVIAISLLSPRILPRQFRYDRGALRGECWFSRELDDRNELELDADGPRCRRVERRKESLSYIGQQLGLGEAHGRYSAPHTGERQ